MDVLARAPKFVWYDPGELARAARERLAAGGAFSPELIAVIRRTITNDWDDEGLKKMAAQFTEPVLNLGEAWADAVLAELPGLGGGWPELIAHATAAKTAKPSSKWDDGARRLLEVIGPQRFRDTVIPWLALVGKARTIPLRHFAYDPEAANELFDPFNVLALRGLLWALSLTPPTAEAARALGAVVETSLRKVPGIGPLAADHF